MEREDTKKTYKQVQFIREDDTRTIKERHDSLPVIRDEDLPEWEDWWNRTIGSGGYPTNLSRKTNNVSNHR